jgi:formylglycine-generating enzyme required for sulfatase activity
MQNPQYGKIRHRALDKGDFVFQVAKKAVPPPRPADQPGDSDFSLAELEKRAKELEESKAAWNMWQGKMQKGYEDTRQYEQREVPGEWKIQAWKDFAKSFAQDNPYSTEDDTMRQTAQASITRLEKITRDEQLAKERAERLAAALRQQQEDAARRCQVSGCTSYKASGSDYCTEHKCQKCSERAVDSGLCSVHQPPRPSTPMDTRVWQVCWNGSYFDFTQDIWVNLQHSQQFEYAKTYQAWYGKAKGLPLDKVVEKNGSRFEFRLIPPGKFWMGSDNEQDRDSDEGPRHKVTVSKPYYLGKTEVTQEQWYKVTGKKPWSGQSYVQENGQNAVSYVSWNDIRDKFLSKLGSGYALPTEAEWEYACRGGTVARFYWGNDSNYSDIGEYAWYNGNAHSKGESYAHTVGQKKENGWGLYDMSGNVYEWCSDWKANYSAEEQKDPVGPRDGSGRLVRGGDWGYAPQYCRSANRDDYAPEDLGSGVGFRLQVISSGF